MDASLVIVLCAVVTYLTRAGGWLVLSRFERVHPRVEAALDAVPAAVMTTLVAPPVFANGPAEAIAIAVTIAASLRFGASLTIVFGMAALVVARMAGL